MSSSAPEDTSYVGLLNPSDPTTATLSVETAWHKFMTRLAVTNPRVIQDGSKLLDGVDRITGRRSR